MNLNDKQWIKLEDFDHHYINKDTFQVYNAKHNRLVVARFTKKNVLAVSLCEYGKKRIRSVAKLWIKAMYGDKKVSYQLDENGFPKVTNKHKVRGKDIAIPLRDNHGNTYDSIRTCSELLEISPYNVKKLIKIGYLKYDTAGES